MTTTVHFMDVGQGNMVLDQCASGTNFVVDCNITEENKDSVLGYVAEQIGSSRQLHAFICTHRDADHMRGVRTLHNRFPIQEVWDSGYPGTSTDTDEYNAYMRLRNDVGSRIIEKQTKYDYGRTRLRFLSAKDDRLPNNANDQGLVLKVEQRNPDMSRVMASTILTGGRELCSLEGWHHEGLRFQSIVVQHCDGRTPRLAGLLRRPKQQPLLRESRNSYDTRDGHRFRRTEQLWPPRFHRTKIVQRKFQRFGQR